ncbi:class I SAM-dependent methyltransferase [Staphylococcus phage JPL-50]|uniref:Class I SAM-dependent methyltransferase n=1 Tax=Staphylococcus phage JPL-50 TaxID=2851077 RepID=A0A8F3C9Q8_9CAUD|nr:class I SAM-dependent methyltransferase [Staphylococcus phage JPL-50]QWY14512.1 class I SAM-dependent methyltransferase [Staphylococcus phage JPL-50]
MAVVENDSIIYMVSSNLENMNTLKHYVREVHKTIN